jgi:hypothetical protein
VSIAQIVFTLALVAVLVGAAAFFFWRQRRLFREAANDDLPREERAYPRGRAWRLLFCAGLMVMLAVWIAGSLFIEGPAEKIAQESVAARARGEKFDLSPEQRTFLRFYGWYWIGGLLVLLVLVGIAGVELMAVRRHARQQFKKLKDDQRAMIARQAARLRRDRNGHDET